MVIPRQQARLAPDPVVLVDTAWSTPPRRSGSTSPGAPVTCRSRRPRSVVGRHPCAPRPATQPEVDRVGPGLGGVHRTSPTHWSVPPSTVSAVHDVLLLRGLQAQLILVREALTNTPGHDASLSKRPRSPLGSARTFGAIRPRKKKREFVNSAGSGERYAFAFVHQSVRRADHDVQGRRRRGSRRWQSRISARTDCGLPPVRVSAVISHHRGSRARRRGRGRWGRGGPPTPRPGAAPGPSPAMKWTAPAISGPVASWRRTGGSRAASHMSHERRSVRELLTQIVPPSRSTYQLWRSTRVDWSSLHQDGGTVRLRARRGGPSGPRGAGARSCRPWPCD